MDLLLRNGTLVDGSGAPRRPADVAVEGDTVAAVAPAGTLEPQAGTEVVDLDGLVVAPGFIDVHTHYDAQVLWDGDLTPSSWHGVTSVVMGNCGFGVAPTRAEHRPLIIGTLENVEGMDPEALEAGIDWCFETFPEYLAAVERRGTRLNVGAFLGHSPLRLYVVGNEERPARPDELRTMQDIARQALAHGALGISTSRQPAHQGAHGRPVPSRFADDDEIDALAAVLADAGHGVLAVSIGPGLFIEECSALAERHGIPVTWTALVTRSDRPGAALRTLARSAELPGEVYPQIACRPIVMQLTLAEPGPLGAVEGWPEVLALSRDQRATCYEDPGWRQRARATTMAAWARRWASVTVEETAVHGELVGRSLADIADERGTTAFDVLVDLALAEGLRTRFRVVLENDVDDEIAALLADPHPLLGLSDAGAHATQLCDACFSTDLLGRWVRQRGALSLEQAVWRLTGHPHQVLRLADRGLVRAGWRADLVVFDADEVGTTPMRRVADQPGGADRLVVGATGIVHVWVNGTAVRRDGEDLPGVRPGRLLGR